MQKIDAYAHPVPPAFVAVEDYFAVCAEHDIVAGVAAGSEHCPNLGYLADLVAAEPERLRAVGVPIGDTPAAIVDACAAQLAAGMCGIRVLHSTVVETPGLLEAVGRSAGFLFLYGDIAAIADRLLAWLAAWPEAGIIAQHFASIPAPERCVGAMAELLAHPRLAIVASRHGGYDADELQASVDCLRRHVGWDRWLWGSEYPVNVRRGERFADAVDWMADHGHAPGEAAAAFFHDNARRLLFERRWPVRRPLPAELRTVGERLIAERQPSRQ